MIRARLDWLRVARAALATIVIAGPSASCAGNPGRFPTWRKVDAPAVRLGSCVDVDASMVRTSRYSAGVTVEARHVGGASAPGHSSNPCSFRVLTARLFVGGVEHTAFTLPAEAQLRGNQILWLRLSFPFDPRTAPAGGGELVLTTSQGEARFRLEHGADELDPCNDRVR